MGRRSADVRGKVVVITGASGGLGRAVAIEAAERGACVIALARREKALRETVRQCEAAGARARAVVADVCHEAELSQAVEIAREEGGGRVDAWVNNAGATAFGPLEMEDFADHRRVIEINLFGAVYGARAALPVFRRQGAGVMINVGSVLSKIGQPFVPSYVISKFALDGLTEALRAEVASEPGIHVCSIYPYAMSTPHFENGANHTRREPHAMPPAQSPRKVARAVIDLVARPKRNRYVPRSAVLGLAAHWLAPRTIERLLHDALSRWHFAEAHEAPGPGALYATLPGAGAVAGSRPPLLSTARLLGWTAKLLLVLELAAVVAWFRRRGR